MAKGSLVVSRGPDGRRRLDLVGTADVDVVGDQGLEEPPGPARIVEDQGPRHLDLAHGELPPIPGGPVRFAEGIGDHGDPAVEETLDIVGTEAVADGLEALGLGAGGKAVGQLGEVRPSRRAWRLAHS